MMAGLIFSGLYRAVGRSMLAAGFAWLTVQAAIALQAIEDFSSPPNWIVTLSGTTTDVGYKYSQIAGGVAVGEGGGNVTRMAPSYAMDIGSLDPSNENLSAGGTMSVNGGGNVMVGWWNQGTYTGSSYHPQNFMGLYTDRQGGIQQVFLLNVANNTRTQTLITSVTAVTPFLFSIQYNYNGGSGNGALIVTINGVSQTYTLPAGMRDAYAEMDRFGMCGTNQASETGLQAFIDDIHFTSDVPSTDLPQEGGEDELPPTVPDVDALDPSGSDTSNPVTLSPPFPSVSGLSIVDGGTVPTGATGSDSSFRFPSGVISARNVWSPDNGATWQASPPAGYVAPAPGQDGSETAIHLGGNEIFSPSASIGGSPPNLILGGRRSTDNWQSGTVASSSGSFINAKLVPQVGDDGANAGYGRIQDLIHLKDGRVMASTYGRYDNDREPWPAYPFIEGRYKVRVIAMFSPLGDRGQNWQNPVTIASRWMLARGGNGSADAHKAAGYMQSQEGPNESSLARTGAGNIICVMRSGHRKGNSSLGLPFFDETCYYISVTEDEGQTWSIPRQVRTASESLGAGNPKVILLGNGVNVLAGPDNRGGWIAFSTNGGATWNGRAYLTRSNNDLSLARIGYNKFQVYYSDNVSNQYVARTITVHRSGQQSSARMDFYAEGPLKILPGQSSRISWFSQNMSNLTLSGGVFSSTAVSANSSAAIGPLTETTTYTLTHAASGTSQQVTITVETPSTSTRANNEWMTIQ